MRRSELLWFDREFDSLGKPIRSDVREAARNKWPQLCASARRRLGDRDQDIQELFERSVEKVSRFLERKKAPPQDPSGLLVVKFRQEVQAHAKRLERLVAQGSARDLEPLLSSTEWREESDRRIFLEELLRSLSSENRLVWRLRKEGYDWQAIASMLQSKPSTVRSSFWREIRTISTEFDQLLEPNED